MNLRNTFFTFFLFTLGSLSFAQEDSLFFDEVNPDSVFTSNMGSLQLTASNPDSLTYLRFIDVVESSIFEHYKETFGKERAYDIIDSMGYEQDYKPTFPDSVYLDRLRQLDKSTIIDIEANAVVLSTVKY